ncbi:MAG: hypothetical protein AAF714_04870 [Pseudomonadota bacterium]
MKIARLWKDEDGAITVDWVVLTAAMVGLAVVIGAAVANGASERAQITSDCMTDASRAFKYNVGGRGKWSDPSRAPERMLNRCKNGF